ncbi:MAG: hypothetical protein M0T70_11050 [Geobacteraceae bacterium]|nr:hypothetical protein [Geobacteraceae bacterium]
MTEEKWPYNLPIWRRTHRASSPNEEFFAEIEKAYEVSMSNPTSGLLHLSAGLEIENCNPSFLWSDDSRYLVVPQFFTRFGLFRKQRLLLIDVHNRSVFVAPEYTYYFQPFSFTDGRLIVRKNPTKSAEEVVWNIPTDLKQFKSLEMRWKDA